MATRLQPTYQIQTRRLRMRCSFLAVATVCLVATQHAVAQQPAAIPVATLPAELRPIIRATEFVGRVEAVERVDVRARVTGFLESILFKEGDTVKEGDLLYQIEPDTFEAAVQQARGEVL